MTHSTHTKRQLFWNEGSPDIFANWYGTKNVTIAKVVSPQWHEDRICGGREAGANAARIVQCWNAHDDLVNALETLLKLNDDSGPFGGELYQDRVDRAWENARASLAKARGETHA